MSILSPTMERCAAFMREHGGFIHRHPGGFWWEQDPASSYRQGFGTATVEALVARNVATYTRWQEGRNGRFPIEARLRTFKVPPLPASTSTGASNDR